MAGDMVELEKLVRGIIELMRVNGKTKAHGMIPSFAGAVLKQMCADKVYIAMDTKTTKAEWRQIELHQEAMSRHRGYPVSFDEAHEDWMAHFAQVWRQQRLAAMLQLQREEIERYKWIESEKEGHDLGRQAVLDWISKYAATWREWYDQEFEEVGVESLSQ